MKYADREMLGCTGVWNISISIVGIVMDAIRSTLHSVSWDF